MLSARNIFILGIKGVAMVNLAVILRQMGRKITGADVKEKFITDYLLQKYNIPYSYGFGDESVLNEMDLFIYSAAHGGINNPLAQEAIKRKIPVISQAELIAELMKSSKTTIAVSGCHGKTTTSSLLAYSLIRLEKDPSYIVGSPSFNTFDGGHYGNGEYFVVEADEYGINPPVNRKPKFHFLNPQLIICTNIDFDHPDVYKNLENTKKAFLEFFDSKLLILCGDDKNLMATVKNLPRPQYTTYGFGESNEYRITQSEIINGSTSFDVAYKGKQLGNFKTDLFGDKNVSNVTSVIVFLLQKGFSLENIKKAIRYFAGAKRRFEKIFTKNHTYLFDDYAHHPEEIKTTIHAARKRFPSARIIVIFQPHTYSRTLSLLNEFARSLSLADFSYVLPIFASAREDASKFSVKSEDIVRKASDSCQAVDVNELIKKLQCILHRGDIIFTMGAGDVYKLKKDIITLIDRL